MTSSSFEKSIFFVFIWFGIFQKTYSCRPRYIKFRPIELKIVLWHEKMNGKMYKIVKIDMKEEFFNIILKMIYCTYKNYPRNVQPMLLKFLTLRHLRYEFLAIAVWWQNLAKFILFTTRGCQRKGKVTFNFILKIQNYLSLCPFVTILP